MMNFEHKTVFSFHKKITFLADEFDMFPQNGLILAAVSGGPDSMCLLNALLAISSKRGFKVVAAHFNHKLRGDEANRDEAFVIEECKNRNVELVVDFADVKAYSDEKGIGIVEAARDCRYEFLTKTALKLGSEHKNDNVRIATAHNADDLAETLIINMLRGAGALGLSSIPPVRDSIIRPMLHVSRDEIMEYIKLKKINYVEDSTNKSTNQTRNKIRHRIMPIIHEINPNFTESAIKTSQLLHKDDEYLQYLADHFIELNTDFFHQYMLNANALNCLPYPIASRVIKRMSSKLTYRHINDIINLCKYGKTRAYLSLPGMTVQKENDKLIFFSLSY